MNKGRWVYILGNNNHTVYIGVTNNLIKRVFDHKKWRVPGFTRKYKLHKLLYYEDYPSIEEAIAREKQLKNWKRQWKLDLIKGMNPGFKDLFGEIIR